MVGRYLSEPTDVGAVAFDAWPPCSVHLEWGPAGAAQAARHGDVVVIVDVLSFSTTLAIAVAKGFTCLVYSSEEVAELGGIAALADRLDARQMSRSRRTAPGEVSLSPASVVAAEPNQRVLFTSLNGAGAMAAARAAPALLIGGLRNATATARIAHSLLERAMAKRITVVPCGERWSSVEDGVDGLRPSVEDWTGAGLICGQLAALGLDLSAEATMATNSWSGPQVLRDCVSARELVAAGFAADVELGLQVDASDAVPARDDTDPSGHAFVGRHPPS